MHILVVDNKLKTAESHGAKELETVHKQESVGITDKMHPTTCFQATVFLSKRKVHVVP